MTAGPHTPATVATPDPGPASVSVPALVVRVVAIAILWVALVAAFVAIGRAIASSSAVHSFDVRVTHYVVQNRSTALVDVMKVATWLGSWVAVVVTAIALVVLRLVRRLTTTFLILAVALWGGTQAGTTIVKSRVHRSRPPLAFHLVSARGWSFPSGHSATATVVALTLVGVVAALTTRRGARLAAVVLAVVLVASVAASRVVLGVHWTTDVLGGVAFALLWALLLLGPLPAWVRRRALPRPKGVPQ